MGTATFREIFYDHTGNQVHKWDHYLDIYEKYFSAYRGQPVSILEIGISQGGSLQLWKKYFGENVKVYAMDINPQCKKFEEGNIKIFIGSQEDEKFLQEVCHQIPEVDIILDDGGHTMRQQIVSFENLFSKVKEGGLYIVEDTHTSYWHEYHGGLKNPKSFIEYSKNLVDSLYEGHIADKRKLLVNEITTHINGISFYDSIVVFEKQKRNTPFHIRKGTESIEPYIQVELKKPTLWMQVKQKLFGKQDTYKSNDKGKL